SETSAEHQERSRRRRRSKTRSPAHRVEEVTDDDEDVVLPRSNKAKGKEPARAPPSPSPPSGSMPKGILKASVTNPRRPDDAPDHWVYADQDGVVGSGPCGRSGSAESPFYFLFIHGLKLGEEVMGLDRGGLFCFFLLILFFFWA